MANEKKPVVVKLTSKDEKPYSREFEIEQANALLKLPKSAWKLDDAKFEWNGSEIGKK